MTRPTAETLGVDDDQFEAFEDLCEEQGIDLDGPEDGWRAEWEFFEAGTPVWKVDVPENAPTKVSRVTFRVEGDIWVARFAMNHTMDGALFIASIAMDAVREEHRKQQFISMCREVVADIIKNASVITPEWQDHVVAPEHERSGRD